MNVSIAWIGCLIVKLPRWLSMLASSASCWLSMLALSAEDFVINSQSGQIEDYEIVSYCFFTEYLTGVRAKTG
jgi:hypothetical protein